MKHCLLTCLVAVLLIQAMPAQQQPEIIPLPASFELQEGVFDWNLGVTFQTENFKDVGYFLQVEALKLLGKTLPQSQKGDKVILLIHEEGLGGGHHININQDKVVIKASTHEGMFYGVISLLQLAKASLGEHGTCRLPNWTIQDQPKYTWRGLMLDESRYFFGTEKVKQLLDYMAYYKLNKFHWHLTDAPGWRIDIQAYPKLAQVGGIGNHSNPFAPTRYYTQEEIKEIVRYAKVRMIDVIPEIDMPGHATASNRAYPEFSGGGSERYPNFTFHPGKNETYDYLSQIIKEVDVLFPSDMIHLGGDEVSFGNQQWPEDEHVQALMEKEGLMDLKAVEDYFFERMADTLFQLNNKVLAWDEMAGADLPRDKTIIFWWRHDKEEQLHLALKNGYPTVVCPRIPFYFDFVQEKTHQYGRKWAGTYAPLEAVYGFRLEDFGLEALHKDLILGIQANLWTETVHNGQRLDFLLFPRIAALAEAAWSVEDNKSFEGFLKRLPPHFEKYEQDKIYFYHPLDTNYHPEPVYKP